MRPTIRSVLPAVVLAAGACWSSRVTHVPPTLSLELSEEPDTWGVASLSWQQLHPGWVSSYVVEHRLLPGPFVAVAELPGPMIDSFDLPIEGEGDEIADHEVRVRATYNDGAELTSNTVRFRLGVRTPQVSLSTPFGGGFFAVNWVVTSRVADHLLLEKQIQRPAVGPGPWVQLPAALGDGRYEDRDLSAYLDGTFIQYRLSLRAGEEWSRAVLRQTDRARPLAPRDVSATTIRGGVRIDFQNASAWANELILNRTPVRGATTRVSLGVPPPVGVATSYSDAGLASGFYTYSLHAQHRERTGTWVSPGVDVSALSLPGGPGGLDFRLIVLPSGAYAARLPSGEFATASKDCSALVSGADAIDAHGQWGAFLAAPGVVVDRDGQPHAVYMTWPPPGSAGYHQDSVVFHAWHDGLRWQTEEVARRQDILLDTLDAGLDGVLRVTWHSDYSVPYPEVASLSAGGWVVEEVGGGLLPELRAAVAIATAGPDGILHLLSRCANAASTLCHVYKDQTGWQIETATGDLTNVDGVRLYGPVTVASFAVTASHLRAVVLLHDYSFRRSAVLIERGPSGWSAPVLLPTPAKATATFGGARSADGARLLYTAAADDASIAMVFDESGTTTWHWVQDHLTATAAGFGTDGKVWILDWIQYGAPGRPVQALLFEEP